MVWHWQKCVYRKLKTLKRRLWDLNFIFKTIAWSLNKLCMYVWGEGVRLNGLPAFNDHQLAYFYFVLPAYNMILSSFIGLYLVNDVPTVMIQRVYLIAGFTLYTIMGALGVSNCVDNDFPSVSMVMSLVALTNATVIILDYTKIENYFIPEKQILADLKKADPEAYKHDSGVFPHTITPLDPALNRQLMSEFTGERVGFVQVGREGWLLPSRYQEQALGYYTMALRPDDVWIATFPRSGTTWCQEMVWLINNNLDYETAKKVSLDTRFPFLEFGMLHSPQLHREVLALNDHRPEVDRVLTTWRTPGYQLASFSQSPRHFKTHLPFTLLPPSLLDRCKVIYVARNPLDVVVSYFHHNRYLAVHGYTGDFQQYWNYFQDDLLVYSPYWEHLKQAWVKRSHPNLLFLFYEDLLKDLPGNIRKISGFLGNPLNDDQVLRLSNHLQIDNFRNNVPLYPDVPITGLTRDEEQGLIRKGKVNGNSEFTEELEAEANKWVTENLALTDLRFPSK